MFAIEDFRQISFDGWGVDSRRRESRDQPREAALLSPVSTVCRQRNSRCGGGLALTFSFEIELPRTIKRDKAVATDMKKQKTGVFRVV
jgi:hypothetical protein